MSEQTGVQDMPDAFNYLKDKLPCKEEPNGKVSFKALTDFFPLEDAAHRIVEY